MDYLFGTPFKLEQNKEMYHFNSDSELLGRFLNLKNTDRVLDVGTNNGVLLCYASMHNPTGLCGIDLFPEVIALCRSNLEYNGIKAELFAIPLQEFEHEPFTAVVCNPPFFTTTNNSLKSENPYLRAARHSDFLSIQELFVHSRRLLEPGGSLSLVIPYVCLEEVQEAAKDNGFTLVRLASVYDRPGGEIKRLLMEFRYGSLTELRIEPIRYLDRLHEKSEKLSENR